MRAVALALAQILVVLANGACAERPQPTSDALPRALPDSLSMAAESLYWQGEYDAARGLWTQALDARPATDPGFEPRVLTWLGLAAWRRGEYAEARRVGEQALALKLSRGRTEELYRSYNALGLLAWHEGRLADAESLLEQALAAARAEDDEAGVARAANNLGNVYTEYGDFARARARFEATRAAGQRIGDARIEGGALTNLAMLDIRIGDPAAAVTALAGARRLYRTTEWAVAEQNALGQLGAAYLALGEPHRAFAALDSALELSRRHGLRQEEASHLEWLGHFYRESGDLRRALQMLAGAQVINTELDLAVEAGSVLRSQAAIRLVQGDHAKARADAVAALGLHQTAGARPDELHDLLLLAEIEHAVGDRAASGARMASATRITGELDSPAARLKLAVTAARLADRDAQPQAVLGALDVVQRELERSPPATVWEAYALRARALARLGRLHEAVGAGRQAILGVERFRVNLAAPTLRTTYTAERASVYTELAVTLLRLGRVDEAFEVADAARGRALLEHLAAARRGASAGSLVGELATGEELLRRVDALVARLAEAEQTPPRERGPNDDAAAVDLAARLEAAHGEYEVFLLRAQQRDPAAAALLGVRQASSAQTRAALRADEALLQYLVLPERVLIFVARRADVTMLESRVPADELGNRVRLARHLFATPDEPAPTSDRVAAALHELLIRPVEASGLLRDVRHLVIVPHGILSYLPFAALLDLRSGSALADRYTLSNLPSAAALPALRARNGAVPQGATTAILAPFPDRLPASRREAETIRESVRGSRLRLGQRATETELRRALGAQDVVHVASHGFLNAQNPMFSRIELSRGRAGRSTDDGRLEVHEVLGMRVHSRLVFLSGCETGLGVSWSNTFQRGEDHATLAQAFLYAGAGSVVATLWRIEDEGAAEFARLFYRHLKDAPPAAALAAAQRALRRHPRFAHPYYWAAYVLSGDAATKL